MAAQIYFFDDQLHNDPTQYPEYNDLNDLTVNAPLSNGESPDKNSRKGRGRKGKECTKKENFPKIELYRKVIGKEILFYNDSDIVAIATDEDIKIENNIHKLNLNDPQQIVDYIIDFLSLN